MSERNEWQDLVTDVDGFWNEEGPEDDKVNNIVQGRVMGIVTMDLGLGDTLVAVVALTAPTAAVKGSGDAKEEILLETGQAIGVVIKHKLRELESFVENQNEVKIVALKKIRIPNSTKTMWTYKIQFKGKRTLRPVTRPAGGRSTGDAEADAAESMDKYS